MRLRAHPPFIVLLAAVALGGAACPDPVEAAADVRAGHARLDVALDRAVALHGEGRRDLAVSAWRDAHLAWDESLGPGLAPHLSSAALIGLELHLARIRSELDRPGGRPDLEVTRMREALRSPLAALPASP